MNFVITEGSLKSILHKLKDRTENLTEVDKAKGEPEFPNAPKPPDGKYNPNVVINWEVERSLRLPRPEKNIGKFSISKYLKKDPSTKRIAYVIKNSTSTLYDREGWAELAFYYIKNYDRYLQVKKFLGQDPFKFVQKFADVNKKYFVQPISITMRQINQTKGKSSSTEESTTTKSLDATELWKQIVQKCGTLTSKNPAGKKHNSNGVNIYKNWVANEKTGKPTDKLLYLNSLGNKYYAIVPKDFGWKKYNEVYPYPNIYSRECLEMAKKYGMAYKDKKTKDAAKSKKQAVDYYLKTGENPTSVRGYTDEYSAKSIKTNFYYNEMLSFNKDIAKQKEMIPKWCTTPLARIKQKKYETIGTQGYGPWLFISMYKVCEALGGLWVYGVGTGTPSCGCRDNSHPYINANVNVDGGVVNISQEIQKTQVSRDWTHPESLFIVADILGVASAFVPVVGWAISAGIGLGKAAAYYKAGDWKRAGAEAFFAIVPNIGRFKIGDEILESLKSAVINKTPLNVEDLDALNKLLDYDQITGSKIADFMKKKLTNAGKDPEKWKYTVVPTAFKEVEKDFHKRVIGFNSKMVRKNLMSQGKLTVPPVKA